MKFLRWLVYTLFYGNIWIALGAAAGSWQSSRVFGLAPNYYLYLFIFLATLFSYNFDRYTERLAFADSYQKRHQWLHRNRKALAFFTLLPGLGWMVMVPALSPAVLGWLIHLGIISVGYSVPLWRKADGSRFVLRKIGLTKAAFVAYVWAAVCVGLPLIDAGYPINLSFLTAFFGRFCFIMALCIPFDLRDETIDRSHGMYTLPVLLGEKKAMLLAYSLLVIDGLLLSLRLPPMAWGALVISLLYAAWSMYYANRYRHELAYSAGIDGAILLQALLLGFV